MKKKRDMNERGEGGIMQAVKQLHYETVFLQLWPWAQHEFIGSNTQVQSAE